MQTMDFIHFGLKFTPANPALSIPQIRIWLLTATDPILSTRSMNFVLRVDSNNLISLPASDGKWNFVYVGYSKSNTNWYMNVNDQEQSATVAACPHFPKIEFFRYLYTTSNNKDAKMLEMQFWNLTATDVVNLSQFYERYSGISFKYSQNNLRPAQLVDYLSTWNSNADQWYGRIDYKEFLASVDGNRFAWKDQGAQNPVCPPTQKYDFNNAKCIACVSPCSECSYYSESKCLTCIAGGYSLIDNTCSKSDCPKGQYYNSTLKICLACVSPCSTCISYSKCKYCVAGYNYHDNGSYKCLPITDGCVNSTIADTTGLPICRKCPLECSVCGTDGLCIQCIAGYSLFNGKCFTDGCPPSSFFNSSTSLCEACPTGCSHCKINGDCTKCQSTYYLNVATNKCATTCPSNFYPSAESNACMKCQPDCVNCVGNNYTCTKCNSNTFLLQNSCVKQCPLVGYFHNTTARECQPCDSACEVCIADSKDCITCQPNKYLHNRQCVSTCPASYFAESSNNICYPCHSSCTACTSGLHTDCSACAAGNYLLQTTCLTSCPSPYYQDLTAKTCDTCKYFCDACTNKYNCNQCKQGFEQVPGNCTGEYFLRTKINQRLQLPINTAQMPASIDMIKMSMEIWFKIDDISSSTLQVIVGATPYKLRKKANSKSFHLSFQGLLTYCEITNTTFASDTWYHYAFTINEAKVQLKCYFNGDPISIGDSPAVLIAQELYRPTELTLGGTTDPKASEINFVGYLKEFRLWNIIRSDFDIKNGRYYDMTSKASLFFAYWKLNEVNDGQVTRFIDYSQGGTSNFNPSTIVATQTVQNSMEFREAFLKICKEGWYAYNDTILGYQKCKPCDSNCKNCIGPSATECVECNEPQKLLQTEYRCIIVESCPISYFQDPESGLCVNCNSTCRICQGAPNFCTQCNAGYYREYQGTGCVKDCPAGMYGNIEKQSCLFNPIIDYISPKNGAVFLAGTFIDLHSNFTMLNNEINTTYEYGWKIVRQDGNVDITNDAFKTYYQTDIRKVHLDNNIVQANNYYIISFYVRGLDQFYKGMYSEMKTTIYLGTPPKNGKCQISPIIGIATITKFQIQQTNWIDLEPIDAYDFFYSMDGGEVFLPLESTEITLTSLNYTFAATYNQYTDVKIKCKATNVKGFYNQIITTITLEKKSSSDASYDLEKLNPALAQSEVEVLLQIQQLKLVTQYLGNLQYQDSTRFDPKLESYQCTSKLCNNQGNCSYIPYTKKYYCQCETKIGGQNCTFINNTQIQVIKTKIQQLAASYESLSDKVYEFEFMKLITAYKEQLNDVTFGIVISVIYYKIHQWDGSSQDENSLNSYLQITSNLLEYIEYDIIENNVTKSWSSIIGKSQTVYDNMQLAIQIFEAVRQNSLAQVNMVDTQKQFISRMIAFKQVLLSQDALISVSATDFSRRKDRTIVKVTPNIFQTAVVPLESQYILEVVEYAINPLQVVNLNNIASNVFSTTFYNSSTYEKAIIKNLMSEIEFYYPHTDNQNVSDFMTIYNSLSPYKAAQNLKRQKMMNNSNMACSYWDETTNNWKNDGCTFIGVDNTHIKCSCNHLTVVAPSFITPSDSGTASEENIQNKYVQAGKNDEGKITKEDLQVPLDRYFKNLQELLQHKQPQPTDFLLNPGSYVPLIFWFMYISSLIYYTGRDRKRRYNMTKSQNRDDLAEIKDRDVQCLDEVINELIARDYAKKKAAELKGQGQQPQNKTIKLEAPEKKPTKRNTIKVPDSNFLHANESGKLLGEKKYSTQMSQQDTQQNSAQKKPGSENFGFNPIPQEDTHKSEIEGFKSYEEMTKEEKKFLKRRARKKVFGKVGTMDERAKRFYDKAVKVKSSIAAPDNKMKFFYEALKSSLWMGLMSKTSKIAPRHVRLALMYLYISLHLTISSIAFIMGYIDMFAEMIGDSMISILGAAILTHIIPWFICVPVALIFRMPHSIRRQVEGIKTKKINKAFKEIDKQMGLRYAIGYFICYFFYAVMTVLVTFFNYVYPSDYCMSWFFLLVVIYFLDLIAFTFGFAGFQLTLSLLSQKSQIFYSAWAFFEKIRYIKNLRG
eukprot:403361664